MKTTLVDLCGELLTPAYNIISISDFYYNFNSAYIMKYQSNFDFKSTKESFYEYINGLNDDDIALVYAEFEVNLICGKSVKISTLSKRFRKNTKQALEIYDVRDNLIKVWEKELQNINIIKL